MVTKVMLGNSCFGVWNAAQASNTAYFEAAMLKIFEASEKAYQWFNDKPP